MSAATQPGLDAHLVVRREGFTLDAELHIPPGSTAAILGPNGAGKSTAVDAIAGIAPLDAGHVTLDGRLLDNAADVFVHPEARGVGVVFQRYLLFEHLSVRDNVAFGPMSTGTPRAEARARAGDLLDAVGLSGVADRRPGDLSGGQAQRVALARALAVEPALLLLDEPLAALDVSTRGELRRTLSDRLQSFAGPRLLITHDPAEAFLFADMIHVLEDGRITQSGSADEIRRRPATPWVAALAGTNLLTGVNAAGRLTLDGVTRELVTADTATTGEVIVTVHPTAVALHREQPHGSPRNTWQTTVAHVEPLGDTTRVTLAAPLAIGVDITPGATEALGLAPGVEVWASVKATEVAVSPRV